MRIDIGALLTAYLLVVSNGDNSQKDNTSQTAGDAGPDLMTVKETAEYLRIPLPTVYYLVQRGQLPAVQIGGRWRVKKGSLDRDILRRGDEGQPTILVLDDDPVIQEFFRKFLKKYGFSRVICGTAREALAALAKQSFQMFFLDLKLPDMDGDEVFRETKAVDDDLPIVVVTGYPDSDMLDRILQDGPVMVLKKPIDLDQLTLTMRIHGYKQPQRLATPAAD